MKKNRTSTNINYLAIWRNFNNFVIKLDQKPPSWEERASLFGAYLVEKGVQSGTIKSYFSAIKCILVDEGYLWNHNKIMLNTLVHACQLINNTVRTRLPIHYNYTIEQAKLAGRWQSNTVFKYIRSFEF